MLVSKLSKLLQYSYSFEEMLDITNLSKSELLFVLYKFSKVVKDEDLAFEASSMFYDNYLYNKINSTKKIILWSDYHAGSSQESVDNLLMMYDYANNNNIKDLFFLGDLFDFNNSKVDKFESFEKSFEQFINRVPSNKDTRSYFLLGNHDYEYNLGGYKLESMLERERSDFISMGYKRAYISILNHIVAFKHPIRNYKNCFSDEINSLFTFSGHSHIFSYNSYGDNASYVKVPACSNLCNSNNLHSEPGFLVLDIYKDTKRYCDEDINLFHYKFEDNTIKLTDEISLIKK